VIVSAITGSMAAAMFAASKDAELLERRSGSHQAASW
jgi:hypothetical protein